MYVAVSEKPFRAIAASAVFTSRLPSFFRAYVSGYRAFVGVTKEPVRGAYNVRVEDGRTLAEAMKAIVPSDYRVVVGKTETLEVSLVPSFYGKFVGPGKVILRQLERYFDAVTILPAPVLTARTTPMTRRQALAMIDGELPEVEFLEPAYVGVSTMFRHDNAAVYVPTEPEKVRDAIPNAVRVVTYPTRVSAFVAHWFVDEYENLLEKATKEAIE